MKRCKSTLEERMDGAALFFLSDGVGAGDDETVNSGSSGAPLMDGVGEVGAMDGGYAVGDGGDEIVDFGGGAPPWMDGVGEVGAMDGGDEIVDFGGGAPPLMDGVGEDGALDGGDAVGDVFDEVGVGDGDRISDLGGTLISTFCPAWQWPGTLQTKYR